MTYKEQLNDIRWLRRKMEVIERDCNTCQECGKVGMAVKYVAVHHNFYFQRYKFAWEYPLKMLTTLCSECHGRRHEAIDLLHMALLTATTGDLIVWAKRIKNERPNLQRKLTRQANKVKLSPPVTVAPLIVGPDGETAWDKMRRAVDGLIKLQEVVES